MKHYDDDELDRALFALELEEPPADLRPSILAATIYRPVPAFEAWEVATLAALTGLVIALVTMVVMGGESLFLHSITTIETVLVRAFGNAATVGWIAAGGATALWLSLFSGFQPFAPAANKVRAQHLR